MTPAEAKVRRGLEADKRRADQALCARDFLTWGDTRGIHSKFCVWGADEACSRNYDPYPTAEAAPDPGLYEGTGIGALYGLRGSERHSWQLAGWNLTTQEFTPMFDEETPTEGTE